MADSLETINLPRMLCLHGGGTNARIFRSQCRALSRALMSRFRFVYAEAPYLASPGPEVAAVYAGEGPFKRWLRWLPSHESLDPHQAVKDIDAALKSAMDADDAKGANGPWVGILGFSQGAKLAASLLLRQQNRARRRKNGDEVPDIGIFEDWKFAIVMAGRAPIVNLEPGFVSSPMLCELSEIDLKEDPDQLQLTTWEHVLDLPTLHVHGYEDPSLPLHLDLYTDYMNHHQAKVISWPGPHRVVFKPEDVKTVANAIIAFGVKSAGI